MGGRKKKVWCFNFFRQSVEYTLVSVADSARCVITDELIFEMKNF